MRDFVEKGGGSTKYWDKAVANQASNKRKSSQPIVNKQAVKKNKNESPEVDTKSSGMNSNTMLDKIEQLLDNKFGTFKEEVVSAIAGVNERISEIKDRVEAHDSALNIVDARLNAMEQTKLNQQMEVTGLNMPAFVDLEGIKTIFCQYCDSINIHVPPEHITDAYVKTRTNEKGTRKSVIITFIHESLTSRVIRDKIKVDKHNESQGNIFFGPVLTQLNHKLLMAAKNLRKQNKIVSAWAMGGKIYVKVNVTDRGISVNNEAHLSWLIQEKTNTNRTRNVIENIEMGESDHNVTVINNEINQQSASTPVTNVNKQQAMEFYSPILKSPVLAVSVERND